MSKRGIRVFIPTTQGLAEISLLERISERARRSMATLSKHAARGSRGRAADFDQSYDGFVRGPAGIVERLVGHCYFRIEIDKNISAGSSWQLAVTIAHVLEARQRLAQRSAAREEADGDDEVETVIWATGRVSAGDLSVGDVGHVARKIATSLAMLRAYRDRGVNCLVLLPAENVGDIDPADLQALSDHGIEVLAVSNCMQALEYLGCEIQPMAVEAANALARWTGNPYPGLRAFTPELRNVFFGRGRAREETLEKLRGAAAAGKPFLLIHGRSGVGKSSLAMAGLAGDLVAEAHEGGRWTVAMVGFGSSGLDPLDLIARTIATAFDLKDEPAQWFLGQFAAAPVEAVGQLLDLRSSYLDKASLLLVLDQFEQAFPADADDGAGDANALGPLLEALCSSGKVWIVATMRTDQIGVLDTSPALARLSASERTFRLSAPSLYELREIISRPALLAGYEFAGGPRGGQAGGQADEQLVDHLAELALQSPDSLPILQFLLYRMVELAAPDQKLDFALLQRTGGLEGALALRAEDVIAESGQPEIVVERALAGLIRTGISGREIVARPVLLARADDTFGESVVRSRLLAAHLLISEMIDGGTHVRIAHERLITAWPRLSAVAARRFEEIRLRDQLDHAAQQWVTQGRDPDLLLRGEERIHQAEAILRGGEVSLGDHAGPFIVASRARQDEERAAADKAEREKQEAAARQLMLGKSLWRRTVAGAAVAVALTAASAGLATWAYSEFRRASSSEAIGLARLAVDRAGGQPLDAISLALAAIATDPERGDRTEAGLIARHALADALSGGRTMAILSGHPANVNSAIVSDDGTLAVTGSEDGSAVLWDARSATPLRTFRHKTRLGPVAFSRNGENVVTISEGGRVNIWNIDLADEPIAQMRITAASEEAFAGLIALEEHTSRMLGLSDITDLERMTEEQYLAAREALGDEGRELVIETASADLMEETHISAVALSRYGRYALVENLLGRTALWDIKKGTRILDMAKEADGDSYRFSRNGRYVVSGVTRHALPEPDGASVPALVEELGNDPTGAFTVFYGDTDWSETQPTYVADIIDMRTVHIRRPLPHLGEFSLLELPAGVKEETLVALDPGKRLGLFASGERDELRLVEMQSGKTWLHVAAAANDLLDAPQFSAEGTRLVLLLKAGEGAALLVEFETSASEDWRETSRHLLPPAPGARRHRWMLAEGGAYLLAAGYDADGPEGTRGAAKGYGVIFSTRQPAEALHRFETDPAAGDGSIVGFTPDGRTVALNGSYSGTRLLDAATGDRSPVLGRAAMDAYAYRVRFVSEPRTAIVDHDSVSLHDLATGITVGHAAHPARMTTILQPSFGNELIFARAAGSAVVWRPEILSRPLERLACDYLPVIGGKPYWESGVDDPYGALVKVAEICGMDD